ncbi:Bbp19 family protein [Ensifer adhaerens]|uniref:Bbp19 family protein n=1 Tax=Ensifer adhaerens TaxID=106592 RepID=UPI001319EFBC|nr:hypothetical protein [Ensifer adhaerens]
MSLLERAKQYLFRRRTAYVKTFLNPYGDEVLRDLARFCRAHSSTFHVDARAHAVAEGRREVFLRIMHHVNMSEEDLWRLYGDSNANSRPGSTS